MEENLEIEKRKRKITGGACREALEWIRMEDSLRYWGDPNPIRSWMCLAYSSSFDLGVIVTVGNTYVSVCSVCVAPLLP